MTRYGLQGLTSRELLTYNGLVLVYEFDNIAELETILSGVRVIPLPRDIPPEQTMPLSAHPMYCSQAAVAGSASFPLHRRDFK